MTEQVTDFERGYRAGFEYWAERPYLIDMPKRKRDWLHKQSRGFVEGWAKGSADSPDGKDAA